tara:strand:- start:34229 stop:35284 length:1056 start_codon:yes stop_codon:yes gene_type:complete
MLRVATISLAVMAFAVPLAIITTAAPSVAQSQTGENWGLSEQEWATMGPRDIRQRLGLPGSANRVLSAAQANDPKAMAVLSGMYATGVGVALNPSEAFRWGAAAAATGDGFGLHVHALNYYNGTGTSRNLSEFLRLMTRSSDAGRLIASAVVGDAYLAGKDGAPSNPRTALIYYARAADGGMMAPQYVAGLLEYSEISQDKERGLRWLRAAAAQGHPKAGLAVQAIELQRQMFDPSRQLFVAGFGNAAVGAHSVGLLTHEVCQSALMVSRGNATGEYLIDWVRSTPNRNGQYGIRISGAIQSVASGDVADRLNITLHTDQQGDPEKEADLSDLISLGNRLHEVCVRFGNGV